MHRVGSDAPSSAVGGCLGVTLGHESVGTALLEFVSSAPERHGHSRLFKMIEIAEDRTSRGGGCSHHIGDGRALFEKRPELLMSSAHGLGAFHCFE